MSLFMACSQANPESYSLGFAARQKHLAAYGHQAGAKPHCSSSVLAPSSTCRICPFSNRVGAQSQFNGGLVKFLRSITLERGASLARPYVVLERQASFSGSLVCRGIAVEVSSPHVINDHGVCRSFDSLAFSSIRHEVVRRDLFPEVRGN